MRCSSFLYLPFQEKEAEELTKLCDELISKVQGCTCK